uniref:Translocon-associated protein subunit beta n=1 Tax=Caenorhabditis tropicalis TaxID=1561998 RepID=A0A1I7TDB2_9PELO
MKVMLLVFALLASVDASARVLVGKSLISKYPVAEQENVFEYQIVNIGDTPASNVELSDEASFPTDQFKILSGSPKIKFATIPPNETVFHHVIVIPLIAQSVLDRDVIVDYTDSETGKIARVSTNWFSKGRFTDFFNKSVMAKVNRSTSSHVLSFAALTVPLTLCSMIFYYRSKSRYSVKQHN